jgi:hypothetical protein
MLDHTLRLLAVSACVTMSAATAASAGCCPDAVSPCACPPVVVQQAVAPPFEMLIVNQGPVYSGPGSYVTQRNYIEGDQTAPYGFPYVGYVHAGTYVGGYRSFHSGSYHPGYRRLSVRYRYVHAKTVRAHSKVYPAYK